MVVELNKKLFNEALYYIPGGVNSPVRAFKSIGDFPVFMKSGKGSKIYSEDNKEFIDYCLGWGSLILGHCYPGIIASLKKQSERATSLGTATKAETKFAKTIIDSIPYIEQLRLTNSGTEAVMLALRLARAFKKKRKIIKFSGCYHGHVDFFLDYPGIPDECKKDTLICYYNDPENVKTTIEKNKDDIAAIIVEPVAGNAGVILPQKDFLTELKNISEKYKILLIFDEVITGFRFNFGGFGNITGVKPDITCLGKIIGGGLPIGACGGRKEIMQMLSPTGYVFHAGTFAGNAMSVAAGLAALKTLKHKSYKELDKKTDELCNGIKSIGDRFKINIKVNHIGPMFSLFFTDVDVNNFESAQKQNKEIFKKFYQGLLKNGIYFSPSEFESNFVSFSHTKKDIEKTLTAIEKFFKDL